ncbi:hypothetical protein [Paenibacillus koleovorans]|uniref:hypothetical protein n=1 Tax=Paenibacillus koleovorans TaxID=121608 RepID=UPI000FDBFA26|nr:hypothetical protein [Paenibacillus koleovorans]
MAQKIGYRQALRDAGYKDEEIGYDPAGRVTLQGKTFAYATPEADGSTYAPDQNAFGQALRSFRQNELQTQAGQTLGTLQQAAAAPARTFSAPAPFQYNKDADPNYAAALSEARQNITQQQSDTNAKLRASGQGKSSYSDTVAHQIGAKEMARVATTVLPALIDQAYRQYSDNANRQMQVDQANYGAEQDRFSNLAGILSATSGQYQQGFENDRALSQDALRNKESNLNAAATVGQQMGRVLQPTQDWGLLYDQPGAPLNMDAQQQAIAQQQYIQKFNEDVRQFGLQYALQAADQAFGQNIEQQRLGLAQDDNNRQWTALNYEMSQPNTAKYSGLNANQVLSAVRNNYTTPVLDKFGTTRVGDELTTDPNRRYQMFLDVIDSGLPSDAETNQVLTLLGLTKQEIEGYKARAMKEFGG